MPKPFWRSLVVLLKLGFVVTVLKTMLGVFHQITGIAHHDLLQWALNGVWVLIVAGFGWRIYVGLFKKGDWWIEDDNHRRRY